MLIYEIPFFLISYEDEFLMFNVKNVFFFLVNPFLNMLYLCIKNIIKKSIKFKKKS